MHVTKYLSSAGLRWFSGASPASFHLRWLWCARTVLQCAGVLTPEIVSCAGTGAFAGAGAGAGTGAGAGAGAGRRFAFCLTVARVPWDGIVYCTCSG